MEEIQKRLEAFVAVQTERLVLADKVRRRQKKRKHRSLTVASRLRCQIARVIMPAGPLQTMMSPVSASRPINAIIPRGNVGVFWQLDREDGRLQGQGCESVKVEASCTVLRR